MAPTHEEVEDERRHHAAMSVDPDRAERVAGENADTMRAIADDAQRHRAIHHRFVARDSEVLGIDQWESAGLPGGVRRSPGGE
jgi:hypothetical protein